MTPTALDFGRAICGDLATATRREWLVTNGIGGFASGTLTGELTRRYHGLLVAALQPPLGRTLLVVKADDTITYGQERQSLFTNRWSDGSVEPHGYRYLQRFHLEGAIPVWSYALSDALLEKRIWMQPGENTTYLHYTLLRANSSMSMDTRLLVNYRDYHEATRGVLPMKVERLALGVEVKATPDALPYALLSLNGQFNVRADWVRGFSLAVEQYRGFDGLEDHFHAADYRAVLQPGETLTLVFTTEKNPNLNGTSAYEERLAYENNLLEPLGIYPVPDQPVIERLTLAADQFIVARSTRNDPHGVSVIAGYPWFGDWGRDTMIALPGLALATGRLPAARSILRTFASFVSQGMLPNRFPDQGENPEYNTVDASLWYFEAIRAYYAASKDHDLLTELYPVLEEIVEWHRRGTRYQIHVDPNDGLLYAGETGVQLTWMDAKAGDWVVTPRIGKPVEINALWYNALLILAEFSSLLGRNPGIYEAMAERARVGFSGFWNESVNYCYDVIDGPSGVDTSLRPNQLFAVSLPHSPLNRGEQKGVVDACARSLLTSHGLRSLAPDDLAYLGVYGGDRLQRDGAYHQGTVWSWLIGSFVEAHLRVYGDKHAARRFLPPLVQNLEDHGVGSISEIFDGDPPHTPRGCFAQAWGVAELLRVWILTGIG